MERFTIERKLGLENARKVLKAFSKNTQHFGFIKVSETELAELISLYNPPKMANRRDVFCFRDGIWMVVIVVQDGYVEVSLINPYDVNENFHTSDI